MMLGEFFIQGVPGIGQQIHQDLLDLLATAQDQRQVRLQFDLQFDLLALDDRPDQGNGPIDNVFNPGRAERLLFLARELQQIADDLRDAL